MRSRPTRGPAALQACLCALLLLLLLLLSAKVHGQDPDCEDELKVHRDTVYDVSVGENLRIPCPVTFCQTSKKTITWNKLEEAPFNKTHNKQINIKIINSSHISTELIMSSSLDGTSYLRFNSIRRNDSGLYQCETGNAVSFNIKVSVNDSDTQANHDVTNTTDGPPGGSSNKGPFLYIYTSAGIVALVVVVIVVSVVWMRGCKGTPETEAERELQYASVSMKTRPSPAGGATEAAPRGSPRSGAAAPTPQPRDGERTGATGKRQRGAAEKNSVVYAALNHQPLEGAPSGRPRRAVEEKSEYAAIRVS